VFATRRTSKRDALTLLYPRLRSEEVEVWRIAAAVMHELRTALGGVPSSVARELENLGEPGGDSLLTELLPLPRVGTKDRPQYLRDWFGFSTIGSYIRAMLGPDPWKRRRRAPRAVDTDHVPGRVQFLRSLSLLTPPPRFIVCYGPGWWPAHEAIFQVPATSWTTVMMTGTGKPTMRVARLNADTVIACTGFFGTPPRAFYEGTARALGRALLAA
jgi:hypothetical protein